MILIRENPTIFNPHANSQLHLSSQRACSCLSTEVDTVKSWCTHALNASGKLNIWKSILRNLLPGLKHSILYQIKYANQNQWVNYPSKNTNKCPASKRLRTALSFRGPARYQDSERKACKPHLSIRPRTWRYGFWLIIIVLRWFQPSWKILYSQLGVVF